ncbi:MAG: sulfatase-like hydrolase/transferase [Chitinophagales bacterium]|jgi:hypothetical protein|nr:sulfatase-like hydrolase/transferase [Chitinophagales bacterium]
MANPKHIIFLVADSLRKDSVYQDMGLDYIAANSSQFTQARSSACWTLPATSCLFTGLNVHEHGTDTHTRRLKPEIPVLSEILKSKGYTTIQVTANPVTTHVFGLDRGFDEMHKVWSMVTPKLQKTMRLVLAMGKPRVRNMLFSKDIVSQQLLEDLEVANCWGQVTQNEALAFVNKRIEEADKKGEKCFFFINIMETHFPYHIADTFSLLSKGLANKLIEARTLFQLINQNFLYSDNHSLKPNYIDVIFQRQKLSFQLIKKDIDNFVKKHHENQNNLVVFCSDHGDNFGEMDWFYHFSNVTDAGNRVPFFWLDNESNDAKTIDTPVSTRFVFDSILEKVGISRQVTLFKNQTLNMPLIQSYWYHHQKGTLDKYKYNQFLFVNESMRYLKRNDQWFQSPITHDEYHDEPHFQPIDNLDPIEEFVFDEERKNYLRQQLSNFSNFSKIPRT